jgi:hypothetical protein
MARSAGGSAPPLRLATFADLDDGYGGSRGFLRECGVDDATMDELVERLVE